VAQSGKGAFAPVVCGAPSCSTPGERISSTDASFRTWRAVPAARPPPAP